MLLSTYCANDIPLQEFDNSFKIRSVSVHEGSRELWNSMGLFSKKRCFANASTNTANMANAATNTLTEAELLAPLASMEDLSVIMTPMTTPGASPRTRRRWSQRSSTGSQYEPFIQSPLVHTNNKNTRLEPMPEAEEHPLGEAILGTGSPTMLTPVTRNQQPNSLLRQSLTRNGAARFVTPYRHDPDVMNADLPISPQLSQQGADPCINSYYNYGSNSVRNKTTGRFPVEADEETLLTPTRSRSRQVQFLTPRQSTLASQRNQNISPHLSSRVSPELYHHHHHHCHHETDFDDRLTLIPEPKDRSKLASRPAQSKY